MLYIRVDWTGHTRKYEPNIGYTQDVTDDCKVWRWEFSICLVDMVTSSAFVIFFVHFYLQSAVFNLRKFIHTLPTMNIVENTSMTTDTATIAGARGAGPPSVGITPGGGTAAGILQRSVPGGNWEAIFVSLICVVISELFQFPQLKGYSIPSSGSRGLAVCSTMHTRVWVLQRLRPFQRVFTRKS